MKIIVVYYSRSGNTEKVAHLIGKGIEKEKVAVEVKRVQDTTVSDLQAADGIILGSPTYYGTMAAELKFLLDTSVQAHGSLDGKVAGAFSTAANIAGGNETTVMALLQALLIHGCVIQGDPAGSHYGPVSIGSPDARVEKECARFAKRFVSLLTTIAQK